MWKITAAVAALASAVFVSAGPAAAQPSSSLSLVVLGSAGAAATQPHLGSQVTFDLQTPATQPWVSVACYQGGTAVYGQYWGFWSGYSPSTITSTMAANGIFTLGSPLWTSGSANCTATLYTVSKNYKQTTLATLAFAVAG